MYGEHRPTPIARPSGESVERDGVERDLVTSTNAVRRIRHSERLSHHDDLPHGRLDGLAKQQASTLDVPSREELLAECIPRFLRDAEFHGFS